MSSPGEALPQPQDYPSKVTAGLRTGLIRGISRHLRDPFNDANRGHIIDTKPHRYQQQLPFSATSALGDPLDTRATIHILLLRQRNFTESLQSSPALALLYHPRSTRMFIQPLTSEELAAGHVALTESDPYMLPEQLYTFEASGVSLEFSLPRRLQYREPAPAVLVSAQVEQDFQGTLWWFQGLPESAESRPISSL